ncbi:GrlR family regulatory protein [Acinetobacter junii]|uniref:GrlR family regulatory protein n=1 Tax=Acinetobacter junii TaxID=40215 RepID=UPI00301A2C9B
MRNGIYSLFFKSEGQNFGHGFLVVQDGFANGADSTYSYNGKIEQDRLILTLNKYNYEVNSYFGTMSEIKINLNFHEDSLGYLMNGNVENLQTIPLIVQAVFVGNLF